MVRVFVEPHQVKDYCLFGHEDLIEQLPEDNQGLQYALNYIHKFATEWGFDVVFKLDDDVKGFTRRGPVSVEVFIQMLTDCLDAFEKHPKLGGIGFPYSHQMFSVNRWAGVNQRLQTCYLVRPQFLLADASRADPFEDFIRYLLIRKAGFFTLRYGFAGISCAPVGKNQGGLQDWDRCAAAERSRAYIQELLPAISWRNVSKPWKQEPDFSRTTQLRGKGIASDSLPDAQALEVIGCAT